MYQVLAAGGWVMPFIMVCSVLALAICFERQFALNKQRIESIVVDLEREAIKLVDALHSNQKTEYDL